MTGTNRNRTFTLTGSELAEGTWSEWFGPVPGLQRDLEAQFRAAQTLEWSTVPGALPSCLLLAEHKCRRVALPRSCLPGESSGHTCGGFPYVLIPVNTMMSTCRRPICKLELPLPLSKLLLSPLLRRARGQGVLVSCHLWWLPLLPRHWD